MDNESIKKIDKPWGYEIIWAQTDRYLGKFLHIKPQERLSLQYHKTKMETIYVMAGTLELQVGQDNPKITECHPGSVVHLNPGEIHRFSAKDSPVMLCEVSSPEIDDVIRLEDDYNR
jgi:mannose-6-phosphate isomerase